MIRNSFVTGEPTKDEAALNNSLLVQGSSRLHLSLRRKLPCPNQLLVNQREMWKSCQHQLHLCHGRYGLELGFVTCPVQKHSQELFYTPVLFWPRACILGTAGICMFSQLLHSPLETATGVRFLQEATHRTISLLEVPRGCARLPSLAATKHMAPAGWLPIFGVWFFCFVLFWGVCFTDVPDLGYLHLMLFPKD